MKCFLSLCALLVCFSQSAKAELEPFGGGCKSSSMDVTSSQCVPKDEPQYLVVDLSGGANAASYPVSTLSVIPEGGWTTDYKTTKLVLRRIDAGTFMMGSPDDELGRRANEDLHQVTLTKPYYMGVFELTQKQWSLVMGNDPANYKGDTRPVEHISYIDIRGAIKGVQWPASTEVDATSFMGRLRAKTSLGFDLPTEAQWEYACRAGTATALSSGKNLTNTNNCPNMNEVGRYGYNNGYQGGIVDDKGGYPSNHTTVGSYLPNGWGLYDMHGNVWEWSLNWLETSPETVSVKDPKGSVSGTRRLFCGGSWSNGSWLNRSVSRRDNTQLYKCGHIGVRLVSSVGLQ